MKNKLLQLLLFSVVISFGFLSTAGAFPFAGEYMFTVTDYKNDTSVNMGKIEDRAETWFFKKGINRDVDFDFQSRVDAPDTSDSGMTVTYYKGKKTGEWTTDAPIEFYTVKGSKQFALYWLEGGAQSGLWSTEHVETKKGNQPTISHLSGWNPLDPVPTPLPAVPEPSTMVLWGLGVMGLVGVGRKKFRK